MSKVYLRRVLERGGASRTLEPHAGFVELDSGGMAVRLIAIRRTGTVEGRAELKAVRDELLAVLLRHGWAVEEMGGRPS